MFVDHVIKADLPRHAPRILDAQMGVIGTSAAIFEEMRIVHAHADIGLEGTEIGDVILGEHGRGKQQSIPEIARTGQSTRPFDGMGCHAANDFNREIGREEIADIHFRHIGIADMQGRTGNLCAARIHFGRWQSHAGGS